MEIERATLTQGHARLKSKDREWGLNNAPPLKHLAHKVRVLLLQLEE